MGRTKKEESVAIATFADGIEADMTVSGPPRAIVVADTEFLTRVSNGYNIYVWTKLAPGEAIEGEFLGWGPEDEFTNDTTGEVVKRPSALVRDSYGVIRQLPAPHQLAKKLGSAEKGSMVVIIFHGNEEIEGGKKRVGSYTVGYAK